MKTYYNLKKIFPYFNFFERARACVLMHEKAPSDGGGLRGWASFGTRPTPLPLSHGEGKKAPAPAQSAGAGAEHFR